MAARFPIILFPSSRDFSLTPLHSIPQRFNLYSIPTRKRFTLCASAAKKPRASRKLMNDEELCNDIREFSSLHGLPEGQVPSMKDLSTHGRKDLANIVRRRGYKLVGELLLKSLDMKADEATLDEQNLVPHIEIAEASINRPLGQCQDGNSHDELGSSQFGTEMGSEKSQDMMTSGDPSSAFINQIYTSSDFASTTSLTMQEKVSNFTQLGDLDIFEDELQVETVDATDPENDKCIMSESETEISCSACPEEDTENESDELYVISSGPSNGRTPATNPCKAPAEQDELRGGNLMPMEISNFGEYFKLEGRERENQDEINHLKFELQQKDLELSKLKEQIEKEKLALSHMQAKAEAEINKALKLVEEKDTELSTVEEQLSGLKEVQIQYKGEGSTVEVAGSFNGWHHQIKMELQLSSTLQYSAESRKNRLWSTTLWLYPGVYEIKFIVDGHWRVDQHSESITRGSIHNNILRVER